MSFRIFELYSGIGGMHFALKESQINGEVIRAIDINTTANAVYRKNFPTSILLEKNIQSLRENDFSKFDINMILMSPPCQPHTRNGLRKDNLDERSESLLHIITLIPQLKTVDFILLENVKGFETSAVRENLLKVLNESGFIIQEFLLTPTQFCIPNSRLRYYLLAKRKHLKFCFDTKNIIMEEIPKLPNDIELVISNLNWKYRHLCVDDQCFRIGLITEEKTKNFIPEKVLKRYCTIFDIVTSESVRSCCFTKGYTHYAEGTGSVLSLKSSDYVQKVFDELKNFSPNSDDSWNLLKSLGLRYFTPKEVSKLMCFPDNLAFPDGLTDKQKYRLLGNSINVHVVGLLIRLLVS